MNKRLLVTILVVWFLPALAAAEAQPLYLATLTASGKGSDVLSTIFLLEPGDTRHLINSTALLDITPVGAFTTVKSLVIAQGPVADVQLVSDQLFTEESANGSGVVSTPRGPRKVLYGQGYKPDVTQAQLDALLAAATTLSVAGFEFRVYCPGADEVTIELHPMFYGSGPAAQSLNSPLLRVTEPLRPADLGTLNREGQTVGLPHGS